MPCQPTTRRRCLAGLTPDTRSARGARQAGTGRSCRLPPPPHQKTDTPYSRFQRASTPSPPTRRAHARVTLRTPLLGRAGKALARRVTGRGVCPSRARRRPTPAPWPAVALRVSQRQSWWPAGAARGVTKLGRPAQLGQCQCRWARSGRRRTVAAVAGGWLTARRPRASLSLPPYTSCPCVPCLCFRPPVGKGGVASGHLGRSTRRGAVLPSPPPPPPRLSE